MNTFIDFLNVIAQVIREWGVQIVIGLSLISGLTMLSLNLTKHNKLKENVPNQSFRSVSQLTQLSMLLAIAVILRSISPTLPIGGAFSYRVPLATLPIIVSGFVFGPLAGAAVGALTDILGYIIAHSGLGFWTPGIAITLALTGALPITLFRLFKHNYSYLKYLITIGLVILIINPLNTFFLSKLFGIEFMFIFPLRMLFDIISIPIIAKSVQVVLGTYEPLVKSLISKPYAHNG